MKGVSKSAEEKIKAWLEEPYDEVVRNEVKELIQDHPEEIEEAFGSELKFGTAGLRAKMGPGPGRMNKYTIQTVTQGLANYIRSFPKEEWKNGVVICHDSRNHAREFAEEAAMVLAANKIPVHLVKALRPTPFASFCVRYYQAIAGINITASHNPKEYNGYKVYWSDGGQVVSPHDEEIVTEIEKIKDLSYVELTDIHDPLITLIDKEAEEAYLNAVTSLLIDKETNHKEGNTLSIIYSPLNGAGGTMIPEALKRSGFTNISLVEEQKNPDGNFPTTPYPNPETDRALTLGWRDLKTKNADILLVSDPDSDRISCSFLLDGIPKRLTGNEMGIIMLDYLLQKAPSKEKFAVITTIVSSQLIGVLTKHYKGTIVEVLTGFKYIGEKIHNWETEKNGLTFFFGMEESLGYLYGTHARDKDATIAACIIAEIALHLKKEGKTLQDRLFAIYQELGIHREDQIVIEPKEGLSHCLKVMTDFRKEPPKTICNIPVVQIDDYQISQSFDCKTNKKSKLDLPKSNVLSFHLEDGSRLILRPSGTEPKMKIYGSVTKRIYPSIKEGVKMLDEKLSKMLKSFEKEYF